MLFEYAVEPKAIGASWESFRYLIEKFGFDRGRLISRFPKTWERQVIDTAQRSGMKDIRYKSLVNRLQKAKREALIRSNRKYEPSTGDWLDNALRQHTLEPFHAIIASENRGVKDLILVAEDIDEDTPLMIAPANWEVERVGKVLAEAMSPLLKSAKKILFVDRYFDIREPRDKETLEASLAIIDADGSGSVQCEIHFCDHDKRPSAQFVTENASGWFSGVIPEGLTVLLFSWKEKKGGDDFHARYLLTDRGGMIVDAGFRAVGKHQKVLLTLLDLELCREKLAAFEHDSTEYELIGPILQITSDGGVRRV